MISFLHFLKERVRDYKKEYRDYQGKPAQLKYQSDCHKARRKMGLGNSGENPNVEVDHKTPQRNLRVVSRTTNRKKGNKSS